MTRLLCLALAILLLRADPGLAAPQAGAAAGVSAIALPAPSSAAATPLVVRDAAGMALHAVALEAPLTIDGRLDEALYRDVAPISDFIQVEPLEGAAATERTELWIAFDRDHVYVSFRCFESEPGRLVAKEMRRDNGGIWSGDDNVAFIFDTFNDKRNGFQFTLNSIGGRQDAQIANERQWGGDWNTIWDFKVTRFAGGWTVETAIPFKSLRYRPGDDQVWGFNAFRTNRWKNELSFLKPTTKAMGQRGLLQTSMAVPLRGLVAPSGARNLEIKPYLISDATGTLEPPGTIAHDVHGDFGVDVKYGISQNLTADLTYNTDFAQVEADQQQVNLTRFSLFFPEKREFFLENQGTFQFGLTNTNNNAAGDTPILFYSRRIGLEGNRVVPIDGGGRVTGRLGRYSIGALNIQSEREPLGLAPPTGFSVVRVRRDLFRRSSVGALYTGRHEHDAGGRGNEVYGVDGTFAFFANLGINTYWAESRTEGTSQRSYRTQLDYAGDRYGLQLERLVVGDNFNPGLGYVRRDDMAQSFGAFRFSPRPRSSRRVRRYSMQGSIKYVEDTRGHLETRDQWAEFATEFQNGDRFSVANNRIYEYLPRPFRITPGVTLPVGGYHFDNVSIGFNRGPQHRLSGNLLAETGTFYSGHKTALSLSSGRMMITPRISAEPTYAINWVDLVEGSFTTQLAGARVTYTPTALMFASALMQYNSSNQAVSANVRLRWEYRPGSELFVVYNEERNTLGRRFPDLANRAFIVKVNRLLRF